MKPFTTLSALLKQRIQGKFLVPVLAICTFSVLSCQKPGEKEKQMTMDETGQGIILNICADALVNHPKWEADIDSLSREQTIATLQEYVAQYANTQVNRLLFNVNYLRACYDSKVMEPYWDVPDPEVNTSEWPGRYWQVHKKGIDIFEVCIPYMRNLNVSPWLSFRMNDHHYHNNPFCLNKLLLDNPDLRLSPTGAFNYAKEEVREYYKSLIKEALERYDVDGIELDWMRTNDLFKPGEEEEGIKIINQFMKEIRSITDQNAKDRGHPVEIAARVPARPGIGRKFGLDGVVWAKDHSLDILIPTNAWHPTNFDIPVELWRGEIGDNNPCMIAPGADIAFMSKSVNSMGMANNIETMRAFAISAYSRGAGSVYLFNHQSWNLSRKIVKPDGTAELVNDKPLIIQEGGKFSTISGKPRRHVLTFDDPGIPDPRPFTAIILKKGEKYEFDIYSGPKPEGRNYKGNYIVRVALGSMPGYEEASFEVRVNERPCKQLGDMPRDPAFDFEQMLSRGRYGRVVQDVSETGARVIQFNANLKTVKNGYNHITILNEQESEQEITWMEVFIE